jgi:hypothetical protein
MTHPNGTQEDATAGRGQRWRTVAFALAAVAVGVAGLAQAGVLAPNFQQYGGGIGGGSGSVIGTAFMENVSWRAWTVTATGPPSIPGLSDVVVRIAAFADDAAADRAMESSLAAARPTSPATDPITVPRGGVLAVYMWAAVPRRPCPRMVFPDGQLGTRSTSVRGRPVLSIVTPLGTRHIRPTVGLPSCGGG